jgi:predicted nucleic-acid-binding protein
MVSLIDTNVIIRFLAADIEELHRKSTEIFKRIYRGELQVEILGAVLMEVLFVMDKGYKDPKSVTAKALQEILMFRGVVNPDKHILIDALAIYAEKKIDFVDALICTKAKMESYGKISFDKDVTHKCE